MNLPIYLTEAIKQYGKECELKGKQNTYTAKYKKAMEERRCVVCDKKLTNGYKYCDEHVGG